MKFDGIIFDLDGTLWDSRAAVCESWGCVIRRDYPQLKVPTPEEFGKQMGKLLADIGRDLFPELPEKENNELIEKCCANENEYLSQKGGILFEGLEETLARLAENYKLIIVSNCQSGYIEAFFKGHGLEKYFVDYTCSGDTGMLKADNIKLVIERNNLEAPVYVGDTALDGTSAAEAGIPFIWASYGFGEPKSFDAKLSSITELPALCENNNIQAPDWR